MPADTRETVLERAQSINRTGGSISRPGRKLTELRRVRTPFAPGDTITRELIHMCTKHLVGSASKVRCISTGLRERIQQAQRPVVTGAVP